ncbi:T9SS type A sorting domain-containing protein [Microscilla marina]|nr:T9SS type A sorting domain-containing protein [Microscilla marina]
MRCKFLLTKLGALLCLMLFFAYGSYAQVAEWAPTVNTAKVGGVFTNLTDNSWFNAANWNFTSGTAPGGIPDQNTTVIIKSGTAPCYIEIQDPSANNYLPRAKSITIENNAGLFNIAGKGLSLEARFLEVADDFIINTGGTYLGNTEELRVNSNFLNNGDFIIKQGENVIEVGGNYTNNSRISKETSFTNRKVIIDFRKATNSVYTNNNGYDNTYTVYTTFNTSPGTNAFTDQELYVSNAVDEMLVTKESNATVTNNTSPATPIYVGVVTSNGDLVVTGTGNLTIISGSLIVKNVVTTTSAITVADGSTTHPRGYSWNLPNADISVRGNLTVSDAGPLGSGNGASIDLFDTGATASSIALHLGGDLFDENTETPSNTPADRRGFYVGVSTITTNTNGNDGQRPWLIMNGVTSGVVTTQTIRGRATLLNDAADEGTEGPGILLPRVVVLDNDNVTGDVTGGVETDNVVELASGARVVGDLTIHKNTIFNLLSNKLLAGDNPSDELNVFGTLKAEPNAEFRMHDDVIVRGRKGGSIIISGSNSGPVFFSRGDTGTYRFAVYSGCYVSVIYGDFFQMSTNNNDYALANTGTATDNTTGGTDSNGGLKVYFGATLDPVNNFSYSRLPGDLTLNMDIPITANSPDDGTGNGAITIDNFFFGGGTNNSVVRNNQNGTVQMTNAIGSSAAGGVGEDFDQGTYSDTGDPDRIIWITNTRCIWQGGVSNLWDNAANWVNDVGGALGFVPGTAGHTTVDVIIPENATRNCRLNVNNIHIEGTLRVNFHWNGVTGTNRRLIINSGVTFLQVGLDFMVDNNGRIDIHSDAAPNQCRVEIGGTINFNNNAATFNEGTSILACVGGQRQRVTMKGEELYTLEVAASKTGDVYSGGAITCNGNLEIKGGIFRGNAGGSDIRVKGDFLQTGGDIYPWNSDFFVEGNWLNTGGTMANAGNGSFNFEPNNTTTRQIRTNGQSFTTVNFNDKYSLGAVTQYDLVDNFTIITSLNIYNDCQLNIPDGLTGNFSKTNIQNGGILSVVGGGTLAMEANETFTVKDGGKFTLIGAAEKYAKLTRQGATGRFTFDVEGTISARYYLMESMDVNGVNLKSTAKSESPGTITYGGGGSGYTSDPDVTITGGGGSGAVFTANRTADVVTSYGKTNGGGNFTQTPVVIVSNGGGAGATGSVILTATSLDKVVIFSGGAGYNNGTHAYSVPGGAPNATIDIVVAGGVITNINVTSAGGGYTATPQVDLAAVAGLGTPSTAASIDAYLIATSIDQVIVPTALVYPVATFSDGIFTDGIDGGAFITIAGNYTTYRATNDKYSISTSTSSPDAYTSALPAGVTHDYGTTPRIDTIYNIVFPKQPTDDNGGVVPYNIKRTATGNSVYTRMILKDALGTFSGEDYDNEATVTAVTAGTPDNTFNPDGIATTDSMVVWRTEGVKRWDGGPSSTGTSWSDPQNWRPDGVPGPGDKVIINYDLLQLQWNVVNGPPDVVAPANFTIDLDLDPGVQAITCRSLTIESILPDPNSTNTRKPIVVNMTKDVTVLENVIISSDVTINPNVGLTMKVGGSWNNDGSFNPGSSAMTVDFDQNFTRTITNGGGSRFSTVLFSQGITDLGSDLYVEGNLTIENGASLSPSNNNRKITLEGDWVNRGAFDPQQGTVQFGNGGSTTQNVTREPLNELQEFYSVIVQKPFGILQTGSRMQINSQLDIKNGKILTAKDKELIFGDNSNIPLVTNQSYIDGPCAHLFSNATTSSNFKFYPIGKNDTYIGGSNANRRIQLSVRSTNVSIPDGSFLMMVMEQFESPAANRTIPAGSNANYVSRSRHWKVTQGLYPNTDSPVLQNGGTDITIDKAKIQLAFDAGSERSDYTGGASNPWLFGTSLEEITFASLGELTILKDSGTDKKGEGDGYPSVTLTDGTPGTGAVITPVITGGVITAMNIVNGGAGYSMGDPPIITIGGGGSQNNGINPGTGASVAVASVDGSGAITGFTISNGGTGYNTTYPPVVTVGGAGAVGRATVAGGVITALEATAQGTGYKNPTVNITGGSPTVNATATAITDANGRVTGFNITNGGSGYTVGSTEWTDAEGSITNINNNQFTVESTGPDADFAFSSLGNGDFTLAWNFIALPIQFLELKASPIDNQKVVVQWVTNNEELVARFEVQASRDGGKTFITLGQVTAKGNGRGVQNYEFVDQTPVPGFNYYRLRQVDENDLKRFTKVIKADIEKPMYIKATPNPISRGGVVKLELPHVPSQSTLKAQLLDMQGTIVKTVSLNSQSSQGFVVPASAVAGMYVLRVSVDGKIYQSKIVVK